MVGPIASVEAAPAIPINERTGVLLEAKLVWGRDVLGVRHVRPRGDVCLRDLALDVPGAPELVIGGLDDSGAFGLRLPSGALVPAGCRMTLRMGRATLRLSLVADDVAVLPRARPDVRVAFGILAAAALHLVVLGFVAHSRRDEGVSEASSRETMQRMISAAEERALAELAAAQERSREAQDAQNDVAAPASADGAPRHGGAPEQTAATAARARLARHAPKTAREEAATFGMLALLAQPQPRSPLAPAAWSPDPTSRTPSGHRNTPTIDDPASLGLSSIGEPGGGLGAGIPLSSLSWSLRPGA